jgi:outer membrane protein
MKNINLITNGILLIAVIVLFALHFSGNKKSATQSEATAVGDSVKFTKLPIAYVNVDSLLINYSFAKDLNEALLRKQEGSRASLNEKAKVLQAEMGDFQKKVDNNAFLSRDRAEAEQRRLMGKQQEFEQMKERLSSELMVQQQKMNEQLRDTINAFLKEYNKEKNYHLIISNTMFDNILYAKESYNITKEVVEQLNERYKKK